MLLPLPGRFRRCVSDRRTLLVPPGDSHDAAARQRSLDQVVQSVAVPLLEGRALCLPVVRQGDDLVWPRRVRARALDPAELLVELAQGLERVGAFQSGVVRDLVVARKSRVDCGPALHHVREDAVDDQVADDHAQGRTHERVEPTAMASGADVSALRPSRSQPLEQHLPGEENQDAHDVEPVGEERSVPRVRALFGVDPAARQDHVVGAAGEQVAAARAAVDEQPVVGRVAALDLGAIRRAGASDQLRRFFLDPPERRDVLVRADQNPGLARAGLRRKIGLPFDEAMASLG